MDIVNSSAGTSGAGASAAGSPGAVSAVADPAAADPAAAAGQASVGSPGASSPGAFSAAPGRLSVGTPVLDVKVHPVAPSSTSGMEASEVMNILHNLDVEGVREAASAHTALAGTLERIAENLVANGQTLAGGWQGDAAQAAVTKFQQMHAQTSQIAAQAKQTGQVLEWTAGVMEKYRDLPAPLGEAAPPAGQASSVTIGDVIAAVAGAGAPGAAHKARANAQAQKYLDELNQHLVTANSSLPSSIGHSTGVSSAGSSHAGTAAGGPGGGTGPSGGGPASGSPYPGARTGAVTGTGSGAGRPSGAPAPTFTPVHPTSTAALQSSAVPGGPATLPAPAPAPAAPSGGALPPVVPVGPVSGSAEPSGASLGNTTDEDSTEGESTLAAEEQTGAGNGESTIGDRKQDGEGAGLPMMGAPGTGQPERERQRESWMNEERNIWGVPHSTVGSEIDGH